MRLPSRPGLLDPELDARLVERCLNGEARAWDALVRRHERLVYAIGRSWRLSDEDLGDLFQDVFAALVKGLPRLRDARTLVRWLSSTSDRIARAIALRRRREAARTQPDEGTLELLPADDEPVGADLERLERQATVRLAMGGLSERCQRLLAALYYEDPAPAYADLARRLGFPVGSLGPTRARCIERLKALLELAADPSAHAGGIYTGADDTSRDAGGRRSRAKREPIPAPDRSDPHDRNDRTETDP